MAVKTLLRNGLKNGSLLALALAAALPGMALAQEEGGRDRGWHGRGGEQAGDICAGGFQAPRAPPIEKHGRARRD